MNGYVFNLMGMMLLSLDDRVDWVKSLTLIEPAAKWVLGSRGTLPNEFIEEWRSFQSLGPENVTESQLEWFTHAAGLIPPDVDPKELPPWPVWMEHRQSLRFGDAPYQHEDSIDRVRNFRKPVLLFKGEGSAKFDQKVLDILGEEFPHAQVETLPGGHALHIVSMKEFMEIFTSFIQS
jgi:pimeloyl-ACP methyl ester carboxylesterase